MTEPPSRVRLCAVAAPKREELIRFRVWSTETTHFDVQTAARALMDRYGPETGAWRWEVAE